VEPTLGAAAPGKSRRLLLTLATLALLALGAVIVGLVARSPTAPTPATHDFAPLVLVWRDTGNYGINGTAGYQIFRLDYTDRCHQRLTLLEHSALPGPAGSYTQLDGRTKTTHAPASARDSVQPLDPADCWPPDRYLLVPIAFDNPRELAQRPSWAQHPAGDGLLLVSHDELITVAGGLVPEHLEITYRPADGLPLHVVDIVNGRQTQRRDVLEVHDGP